MIVITEEAIQAAVAVIENRRDADSLENGVDRLIASDILQAALPFLQSHDVGEPA